MERKLDVLLSAILSVIIIPIDVKSAEIHRDKENSILFVSSHDDILYSEKVKCIFPLSQDNLKEDEWDEGDKKDESNSSIDRRLTKKLEEENYSSNVIAGVLKLVRGMRKKSNNREEKEKNLPPSNASDQMPF